MKNHENRENQEKIENFRENFEKIMKNQNFQKVQKFSHSIWKVPKMFCHFEIHWGALGRRNIVMVPPASFGIFLEHYLKIRR